MDITVTENGGVHIFNLDGEIDIYNSRKLDDALQTVISQDKNKVLLDMNKVPYVDSSGLGAFIRAIKTLSKKGGSLKFVNVQDSIYKLFEMTNLTSYMDIYENEEKAMAAFN